MLSIDKKRDYSFPLFLILMIFLVSCNNSDNETEIKGYPIQPVSFTEVKLDDHYWLPRITVNTKVTIPIAFKQSEETGRIKNFEIAGGLEEGSFCSLYAFDDSDVFKIIEGASYSLMISPDPKLDSYLDTLIMKISKAQEEDGYLYTNRTIMGDSALPMAGKERWERIQEGSHELYNIGHLYEAAVAHYRATGKETLLNVAIKSADLIAEKFGWDKIEKYPGHQEIEIGLVKLYLVTGDQKYLELAQFFLDVRGPEGWRYNQAHQKVVNQREPVGHAVRALYMYSAMADVAAITGNKDYLNAIGEIWENIVNKKLYITGGIGQSGGNEGFGKDYHLPNLTAYCETCASIANVFWNQRMFLLSGNSKYIDVMERTMYNALLSGVSLSGDHFFYPNVLESRGDIKRKEWFGCACCPSNISRFLPSVPGYIYASKEDEIYVNLYISSETEILTKKGKVGIRQTNNYPFEGDIKLFIEPFDHETFTLKLRIPGWACNKPVPGDLYTFKTDYTDLPEVFVNDSKLDIAIKPGYASISRKWKRGDVVKLKIPMPVRKVISHDRVADNRGRIALQSGPLVYCVEDADTKEGNSRHIVVNLKTGLRKNRYNPDAIFDNTIRFKGEYIKKTLAGSVISDRRLTNFKAIPYALWSNRKPGQMLVWIPNDPQYATPVPAPTIAYLSSKRGSEKLKGNIDLIADQYDPLSSNDRNVGYIHWWPLKDTVEYVIFDFDKKRSVSEVALYWFDDGPDGGCRIPDNWRVLYFSNDKWFPVSGNYSKPVIKDQYNQCTFETIETTGLKIEIDLQTDYSSGIHEIIIQ